MLVGYCLNRLDEPIFMALPKPILTEFGIHYRLESCVRHFDFMQCSCHVLFKMTQIQMLVDVPINTNSQVICCIYLVDFWN